MDIEVLSQEFCHYSQYIRRYSLDTIARYRVVIGLLQRSMELSEIDQCTQEKVEEFFRRGSVEKQWAASTFATYHKSLAVFFRWCVAEGHLLTIPTTRIEVPRIPRALPRGLNERSARRLLDIVDNYPYPDPFLRYRNLAIIATFLYAGLRKTELLQLRATDVDLGNPSIFVCNGKGGKDRIIPIDRVLPAILQRYSTERRRLRKTCPEFFTSLKGNSGLTEQVLRRLLRDISQAAGMKFSVHTLRHTFATLMLEGGSDLFALSKMMGHSDIKTTTIYLAASPEHLRAQIVKHPLNNGFHFSTRPRGGEASQLGGGGLTRTIPAREPSLRHDQQPLYRSTDAA